MVPVKLMVFRYASRMVSFGIAAAQTEGAVDLAQLAQCAFDAAGALVVGQVFDELLLQRGSALLGAL